MIHIWYKDNGRLFYYCGPQEPDDEAIVWDPRRYDSTEFDTLAETLKMIEFLQPGLDYPLQHSRK